MWELEYTREARAQRAPYLWRAGEPLTRSSSGLAATPRKARGTGPATRRSTGCFPSARGAWSCTWSMSAAGLSSCSISSGLGHSGAADSVPSLARSSDGAATPSGERNGRAERMRLARLIHPARPRSWRTCGPRRLWRQSEPGLVATQGDAFGSPMTPAGSRPSAAHKGSTAWVPRSETCSVHRCPSQYRSWWRLPGSANHPAGAAPCAHVPAWAAGAGVDGQPGFGGRRQPPPGARHPGTRPGRRAPSGRASERSPRRCPSRRRHWPGRPAAAPRQPAAVGVENAGPTPRPGRPLNTIGCPHDTGTAAHPIRDIAPFKPSWSCAAGR